MATNNPVVIAGTLSTEELEKSIKEIVNAVNVGMDDVSQKFDTKLAAIEENFKKAGTKIGTTFKDSFNAAFGGSFDQLAAAMEKISSSGGKFINISLGGNSDAKDLLSQIEEIEEQIRDLKIKGITTEEDKARLDAMVEKLQKLQKEKERLEQGAKTVGDLDKIIAMEEHRRKKMELDSVELLKQNELLQEQKDYRKEQLSTEEQLAKAVEKESEAIERAEAKKLKKAQAPYREKLSAANTMPAKDIDQMQQKLERLKRAKDAMRSSGLFDETKLNRAQNSIDNLEKKIEQIRSKRPKSFQEVIGMDERGIDAITNKMRALRTVQIDPKDREAAERVRKEYQRLIAKKNELMGVNANLIRSNKALASAFNYLRNRILFAFTIGTVTNFVRDLIKVRQEYELLERSIGILNDDMEKGTQIFNELGDMALKSPFTLVELGTAAKQLSAYNFAASEVVDTTRRLADISAALGVPMERLVYNLGQIKAQGVLNARDARDFANAGFAIVPMLAQLYTKQKMFGDEIVTTSKVYDMMSKKLVTYSDVMRVVEQATDEGGKFFDYQAKQAETLKVQYANLALAYNNMLNDIGTEHQDLLSMPARVLKTMFKHWREIVDVIKAAIVVIGIWKSQMVLTSIISMLKNTVGMWIEMARHITSASRAMVVFRTIVSSTPLGAFAAIISALIASFALLNKKVEEASLDVQRFGESGAEAISNLRMLNKVLNMTQDNTSTYKEALDEVNRVVAEYGIEEIKNRTEINSKIEDTIALIKEESAERQRANQIALGQDKFKEEVKAAQQELEQRLGLSNAYDRLMLTKVGDAWQDVGEEVRKDASILSGAIAAIIEENVDVVTSESEEKFTKGLEKMRKRIQERMQSTGYSEAASSFVANFVDDYAQAFREASYHLDEHNDKVERLYQSGIKEAESASTQKEKMLAYGRALRSVSGDAKVLYDKVMDIVELAKNKYSIDIDIKAETDNIQKEFLNMSADELRGQVLQHASAIKAGLKTRGMEIGEEIKLVAQLSAAYRRVQEESERRNKDTGTKVAKKDVLGDALAKDIQLIQEMQKRYNEYRKMGVSAAEAQKQATDEYGKSLNRVNAILNTYGFTTKSNRELVMTDLRSLRDYFQNLLDGANRLGNAKGIEAAEKAIAALNVEIAKVDTKRISDGLNNQLSKFKDEYELQVELDATAGLGDAMADLLGFDSTEFPKTFQEYMDKVNHAFDEYRLQMSQWDSPWDVFKMTDEDVREWGKRFGLDNDTIKQMQASIKAQKDAYAKYVKDTVKNANTLEYELSDTAGKIAIKERELAETRKKLAKSTTDIERKNLELTIQNQENAIAELKAQALSLLPEYDRVFGSIAEHSAGVARKLQNDLLKVYDNAEYNAARKEYALKGADGTPVILDEERYTKERNKLIKDMQKTQSSFKKIKEAFSPSNKKDVVDYAKGIELVGQELTKLGELVGAIGNITQALEINEDATESINDVSETLKGLGQAAQGYAKIQSGDIIGGATDMITGTFTAINTWMDNSDKRIQRSIQDSERRVQRLEVAYKDLEHAIDNAVGTAVVGSQKLALANKQLQLVELERQLALEKQRASKNRDEERIISLQGQIKDLQYEIQDGYKGIITNLLGISDVASAVENMVSSVVSALRNGENAIDSWNQSIDDMIVNLITKFVSAQVVGPMFQSVIDDMTQKIAMRGATASEEATRLKAERDALQAQYDKYKQMYDQSGWEQWEVRMQPMEEQLAKLNQQIVGLEEEAAQQTEFTKQDLDYMIEHLLELKEQGGDWMSYLQEALASYGLMGGSQKQLSNLQQGIQGITETTAGSLEAYANNMLTQIYVQVGIQSRMLLELQNSYQIQSAIHAILTGVLSADSMSFRVQMI